MYNCSSTELTSDTSNVSSDLTKLRHGPQIQHKDKKYKSQQFYVKNANNSSISRASDQDYSFSAAKLKQLEIALSSLSSTSEALDEFYTDEYNDLMAFVDFDYEDAEKSIHEAEQPLNKSELADKNTSDVSVDGDVCSLNGILSGSYHWDGRESSPNKNGTALWNEAYDTNLFTKTSDVPTCKENFLSKESLESPDFQKMVDEHLQGFGEKRPDHWEPLPEEENRKRRLCRHFLKGHCKRGKACDFLHDPSIFCPDVQKVFLGGLPAHITETTLQEKLNRQGYTVINKPKVLRGFTPQVCLGSVEEAQKLIKKGRIFIDGSQVDVRPYEAFAKDDLDKRLPDDTKRSVFIGGLSSATTGQMIIEDLEKLDVKVVNHPLIKTGFTPKVTLGTMEQAQKLIKMKRVRIHHTLVDIRAYVNFRDSHTLRKKKYIETFQSKSTRWRLLHCPSQ